MKKMCTYTYLKINMFFDCVPISWLRPLFQAFSAISYPKNKPVDTDRAIYKTFDAANISDIICSTACIVQCACCINLDWFSFDTNSTIQKIPKRRSGGKVCLRKEWKNSPRSWGKKFRFSQKGMTISEGSSRSIDDWISLYIYIYIIYMFTRVYIININIQILDSPSRAWDPAWVESCLTARRTCSPRRRRCRGSASHRPHPHDQYRWAVRTKRLLILQDPLLKKIKSLKFRYYTLKKLNISRLQLSITYLKNDRFLTCFVLLSTTRSINTPYPRK